MNHLPQVFGLDPVAGLDAQALVLGTLPGSKSLAARQYYANSSNAFWTILDELQIVSAALPYSERVARLIECKIALWDVLSAARRIGSSDSNIAPGTEVPNNFRHFLGIHRHIRAIYFNGLDAEERFSKLVVPTLDAAWKAIPRVALPSTSGMNTHLGVSQKANAWRVLTPSVCVA